MELYLNIEKKGDKGMSLSININKSLYGNEDKSVNGKSIFLGDVFGEKDKDSLKERVDEKKELALKQARKIIEDAWKGDIRQAESIDDVRKMKEELLLEKAEINGKLHGINEQKDDLKKQFGVEDDSTEQKDLELLCKYQDNLLGEYKEFSKEEIERLEELQTEERTEYQKRYLKLNGSVGSLKLSQMLKDRQIRAISEVITDASIEQLKDQSMVKADKAAEEITSAASEQIKEMIADEAVEKKEKEEKEEEIEKEEKLEAEQKKIEEKEEIEKEIQREEQIEEQIQEQKEQVKENIKDMIQILSGELNLSRLETELKTEYYMDTKTDIVHKQIKKIMEDNSLISEDIKGLEIDLGI